MAAPLDPKKTPPIPFHGYYFVAIVRDNSTTPPTEYRQDEDDSGRKVSSKSSFSFCAYPAEYDWRHRRTFIIKQDLLVYATNNGGQPVTEWPTDAGLKKRFYVTYDPLNASYIDHLDNP